MRLKAAVYRVDDLFARHPLLATVGILALFQLLPFGWAELFKPLDGHYPKMLPFAIMDSITFLWIGRYPVFKLTRWIKICLCLSIIAHVFGVFMWAAGANLDIYDNAKAIIFYLELLAFIRYGLYNGGRKLRVMVASSGMDGMARVSSNFRTNKAHQARGAR